MAPGANKQEVCDARRCRVAVFSSAALPSTRSRSKRARPARTFTDSDRFALAARRVRSHGRCLQRAPISAAVSVDAVLACAEFVLAAEQQPPEHGELLSVLLPRRDVESAESGTISSCTECHLWCADEQL